jgi:hypothetical protein
MEKSSPSCFIHHHGDNSEKCVELEPFGSDRYKLMIPECAVLGDEIIFHDGEGSSKTLLIQKGFRHGGIIIVDFSHKAEKSRSVRRNTIGEHWRASMEWNTIVTRRFGELLESATDSNICGACVEKTKLNF